MWGKVDDIRRSDTMDKKETILRRLYLTTAFTVQVPIYGMSCCMLAYVSTIWWTGRRNPWLATALGAYIPYIVSGMDKSPLTGARWISYETIEWVRSWSCFRCAAQYLRARLVKTHELDPHHAYIFAYHPHGIICMGSNVALTTNATDFPKMFPGIRRWGITLHQTFMVPIYREFLVLLGFLVADRTTLENKLRAGDSIVLIPGGAVEALHASATKMVLYLNGRKGFIRLARETNARIVPCLGFGENQVFRTYVPEEAHGVLGSTLKRLLEVVRRYTRFSTPIITWPIPDRPRVTVVVGKPIAFAPDADVEESHQAYVKAIGELYEKHKADCGHEHIPLEII